MWSPVLFVLFVASVRADADADPDADPEPFLPYVYPQYNFGNSWAALHFGPQQEEIPETKGSAIAIPERDAAYRPSFGFMPVGVAPSPIFAIRDVQAPPASLLQLKKPVESHDVQLLRRPAMMFGQPLIFPTTHVRVPDHHQKESFPVPVAVAPAASTFASQHTAQVPIFVRRPIFPSFFGPLRIPIPVAAPSYHIQHSAQVPVFSNAFLPQMEEEDDDDDDDKEVNVFLVPQFPTELASLSSLRGVDDEPVIPAGIVQSTQPSFKPMVFKNSKAHPDLLGKFHHTGDSGVVAV